MQYAGESRQALSILDSVKWTRERCSLFDVSHMCSITWHGKDAAEFLELMTPADVQNMPLMKGGLSVIFIAQTKRYSPLRVSDCCNLSNWPSQQLLHHRAIHKSLSQLLPTPTGGILDDTMITKAASASSSCASFRPEWRGEHDDHLIYQVVNAGCADKDLDHLKSHLKDFVTSKNKDCAMEIHWDERGLFALQGPQAQAVLDRFIQKHAILGGSRLLGDDFDLSKVAFGAAFWLPLRSGASCFVTRGGYTGEDGFELFVPNVKSEAGIVWDELLEDDDVRLAGLGVRDALRLEAGLCLYGHDIDETTTPIEANLAWTIAKARRSGERANFLGADVILKQLHEKTDKKRRVGLIVEGPAPAREGMELVESGFSEASGSSGGVHVIGKITSGRESPILGQKIAMGYLDKPFNKIGTKVQVKIRSKRAEATVVKMPFVPTKYHKV